MEGQRRDGSRSMWRDRGEMGLEACGGGLEACGGTEER